jgi:hypothetical protein
MLTPIIVRRAPPKAIDRKFPSIIPEDCLELRQNSDESNK